MGWYAVIIPCGIICSLSRENKKRLEKLLFSSR
nr:MAG TPA: hypothetical protein [Caudoviricetes sp.]